MDEIFFEFIPNGRFIKVSAVDPKTGVEVSIVGSSAASQDYLKRLAAQKLARKTSQTL
ncbi:MAG: serine hydroxymethyltransferase [bacterium]|nr:serine hydroxymethyltransferase [bacterium]